MDTMMLTLTLAAGLLAAPEPQKGWVVEIHGYTYHRQAKPQIEPVQGQYYDDLSAFFKQFKVQVEPVKAFYVDDLPAFFKQLKKR